MKKILVLLSLAWMHTTWACRACDDLNTKLSSIRTMSASFSQVVKAKKREVSRSSGKMALARPGRFRWDTQEPMPQLVVADGKQLWVYDVDLEQVTVKKQAGEMGATAALFLSDKHDDLAKNFEITEKKQGQTLRFDLKAKSPKANFVRVQLAFQGDALQSIELFDQLGQHTAVRLTHIKTNPKLNTNLFQFKPPKGVDVVNQ